MLADTENFHIVRFSLDEVSVYGKNNKVFRKSNQFNFLNNTANFYCTTSVLFQMIQGVEQRIQTSIFGTCCTIPAAVNPASPIDIDGDSGQTARKSGSFLTQESEQIRGPFL